MGDTEDAARVDIADERGGDPVADDDANARAAGTESTPGDDGGVASEDATTSGADLDLHVDATRGGVAEASSAGDSQGDDPRTIQAPAIQIPGRAGHHRGRHRRGKSRGGSGGGSGWGSYGGGSGDGFGRFGWGSATIDEWVMSGWNASQSNTPRGGDVSGSPAWGRAAGGFDPFAGSPRAGSFTSGSGAPPTNNGNGNPSHARWSNAASQGGASPRKAGRLSRGSVEPADLPHDGESMHSASHRLGGGSRSGRAHQSQSQNKSKSRSPSPPRVPSLHPHRARARDPRGRVRGGRPRPLLHVRRRARVPHAPGPEAGPFKRRDANGVCRVWRRKRGARSADDGWILTPRRAREGDALAHRGGPGGPGSVTADGGGEGEDRADRVRLMRLPVDPIAKFKSVSRVGGERRRGGAAPAEEEQGERARGGARREAGGQRGVRGVRDGGVRGGGDWRHRHRARRAGASSGAVENSAEGTEEEAEARAVTTAPR